MTTFNDIKKPIRDEQRRKLRANGWVAVPALKDNGAFQWKWIHHSRKKAYSRVEALRLTTLGRVSK